MYFHALLPKGHMNENGFQERQLDSLSGNDYARNQ